MPNYLTFSSHSPTGAAITGARVVVSPNEYAPEGRRIEFPANFSVYVNKQSNIDGSFQVAEEHYLTQIVGTRLYLYHRPLVNSNGTITSIATSDGTIATSNTNAKQGYIEFSALPTAASFIITYSASPDCVSMWHFNTLQDDVMEIQKTIGVTNYTGWPGLRHTAYALANDPADNIASLFSNALYLQHLNKNLRISSTETAGYYPTLGSGHFVQLGSRYDKVNLEGTGITLAANVEATNPLATLATVIELGNNTGDRITYRGSLSGEGQTTIGGALWPNHSGALGSITTAQYTGAMLRVNGNETILGNLYVNGAITVVHSTGETSTILGDFTVNDELFVNGVSHLNGPVETNNVTVNQNLTYQGNLIAGNSAGAGADGHSVVDNLDASEVAHTYRYTMKRNLRNYIVAAPKYYGTVLPKRGAYTPNGFISSGNFVGEVFNYSGLLNAAASSSGAYLSILQLLCTGTRMAIVSGFYTGILGSIDGGWFSKGMMDPGALHIDLPTKNYSAPVYGYTVEELTGATNNEIRRLNVYTPEQPTESTLGNPPYSLYSPGARHWQFIDDVTSNVTNPTIRISATSTSPLVVAFDEDIRVLNTNSPDISIATTAGHSVSGSIDTSPTGVVYVFASRNYNTNIEVIPTFITRAIPFAMPGEVAIGEVCLTRTGSTEWRVNEITSYRPGGYYDSAWIPINTAVDTTSGRSTTRINYGSTNASTKLYFNHNLGCDLDFAYVDFKLFLGAYGTKDVTTLWPNKFNSFSHSLFGHDHRRQIGLSGAFTVVDLNNRGTSSSTQNDASLFYLDGRLAGVQISESLLTPTQSGVTAFNYLRLIAKRTE